LLDAAHQQLGVPPVLVRNSLNTHNGNAMRDLAARLQVSAERALQGFF
jgi:hypothetical protein